MLFKETCRCSSKGCGISRREKTQPLRINKNRLAKLKLPACFLSVIVSYCRLIKEKTCVSPRRSVINRTTNIKTTAPTAVPTPSPPAGI